MLMDIVEVYEMIKENSDSNFFNITGGMFNINNKDTDGHSLLHYAVQANDQSTTKALLRDGIIYNSKNNNGKTPLDVADMPEITDLLQTCKLFFKHVKAGSFDEVSKCITKVKFLVNIKEEGAFSPLHWAANNYHEDVVRVLLQNGANAVQFTDKGNTPLHIAVSKKSISITELLLKNAKSNELFKFINAQTYKNRSTCLHIAAENGCFEIVQLLLKYGAVYDIMDTFNNTPFYLCKTEKLKGFLKVVDDLFTYAKNGNLRLTDELNVMEFNEFVAVTNARNCDHHTLVQVLTYHNHKYLANMIISLLQSGNKYLTNRQWTLKELNDLESSIYSKLSSAVLNLRILKDMSGAYNYDYDINPLNILWDGLYCLEKIYNLLSLCKELRSRLNVDKNISIIESTLKKLQFGSADVSSFDKNDEELNAIKTNNEKYYYKLLYTTSKPDILQFVHIVENGIEKPLQDILRIIRQQKIPFESSFELMKSIEENNSLAVLEWLNKGTDVNTLNGGGESPLHRAINYGYTNIVNILLKKGADINVVTLQGNTFLHLAVMLNVSFFLDRDAPFSITISLLKHGAIYDARNNEGKTPLNVSNHRKTANLLKNIETCFQYVEDDNTDALLILKNMNGDEFRAVTQARNNKGYTLLETASFTQDKKMEYEILSMLKMSK